MSALRAWRSVGPVGVAFGGSLLLSLIAQLNGSLNRDGMLYVRAAHAFLEGGFDAARESFNWLLLPILMALASQLSGLDPETVGHVMNALFMAGASALLVACVARRQPELSAWACIVVLSMTGLNDYRHELLREYGCWFFTMAAFWLALRWDERPGWGGALAVQASLMAAALFRSEVLVLFPALVAWQLFASPRGGRLRRVVMIGGLPALVGVALLAAHAGGYLPSGNRLGDDFERFSLARFDAKAEVLASALIEYARDDAATILLAGSLALVPLTLFSKLGVFVLPLVWLGLAGPLRAVAARHALLLWALAAHVLVLAVFVTDLQFLAGRYVGLSLLCLVPLVAAGLALFTSRHARWRVPIVIAAMLLMLANVVSTGERRTWYVEAGEWVGANIEESPTVYIDSRRVAHHARWYLVPLAPRNDRVTIAQVASKEAYALYVLEVSDDDDPAEPWLESIGLQIVRRFDGRRGDAVLIAQPLRSTPAVTIGP